MEPLKTTRKKESTEPTAKDIKRKTGRRPSAEEKIRIVPEGLKGEEPASGTCRCGGTAPAPYHRWSEDFPEAGKKRLMGDTVREASTSEVKELLGEGSEPKGTVAELLLQNRVLKKSTTGLGQNGGSTCDLPNRRSTRPYGLSKYLKWA